MICYEYNTIAFKGKVNPIELKQQIIAVDSLRNNFDQISLAGDKVSILFSEDINKTTLDEIVANHEDSGMPDLDNRINLSVNKKVTNSIWTNSGKTIFNGGNFAKFFVVSKMDKQLTSYSVRIFNRMHSKTIVEKTFTNTEEQINEIGYGPISSCKTILEVHIRVNKPDTVTAEKEELPYCWIQDVFIEFSS